MESTFNVEHFHCQSGRLKVKVIGCVGFHQSSVHRLVGQEIFPFVHFPRLHSVEHFRWFVVNRSFCISNTCAFLLLKSKCLL